MTKLKIVVIVLLISSQGYAQDLIFSDSTFFKAILNYQPSIDKNGDGIIQKNEAEAVRELNLMNQHLTSIQDLYFFPSIKKLIITRNDLVSVKLEGLDSLTEFYIAGNHLVMLDLALPALKDLACGKNSLKTISLDNLPNLETFNCMANDLSELDLRSCEKLKYLTLSDNNLTQLDISQNKELIQLMIDENPLKSLDITVNSALKVNLLYIDENVELIGTSEQLKTPVAKTLIQGR